MNSNFRQQMYAGTLNNSRCKLGMMDMDDMMDMDKMKIYNNENIERMPIAMAYVPWQQWKSLYDPNKALKIGTIFPELDLPFLQMRGDK